MDISPTISASGVKFLKILFVGSSNTGKTKFCYTLMETLRHEACYDQEPKLIDQNQNVNNPNTNRKIDFKRNFNINPVNRSMDESNKKCSTIALKQIHNIPPAYGTMMQKERLDIPTTYEIFVADTEFDNTLVRLYLHDVGGSQEYDQIRPYFYPDANVILIFYSTVSKESLYDVKKKWLPELKTYNLSNLPIILVGTKTDLQETNANSVSIEDKRTVLSDSKTLKYVTHRYENLTYVEEEYRRDGKNADRVSPEEKNADRVSLEQRNADRIYPHEKNADRASPQEKNEDRVSSEEKNADRESLEERNADRISPHEKNADRASPQEKNKDRVSSEENNADRVSLEERNADRVCPEEKNTSCVSPQEVDKITKIIKACAHYDCTIKKEETLKKVIIGAIEKALLNYRHNNIIF